MLRNLKKSEVKQKWRFFFAVATVIALLAGFEISVPATAAVPDTVNLTVHYNRTNADYAGWNVFVWKNMISGTDGSSYSTKFDQPDDSYGKVAKITVTGMNGYDNLGIIIRLSSSSNDWVKKDTLGSWPNGGDRFVTKFDANGNAEIWLKEGDETIYDKAPVVAAATPKILSALVTSVDMLSVTLNTNFKLANVPGEGFTVTGSRGEAAIASVTLPDGKTESSTVNIKLAKDLDVSQTYVVSHLTLGSATVNATSLFDTKWFADNFTYTGNDLGNTYSPSKTSFRVWAPTAQDVKLVSYGKYVGLTTKFAPVDVAMTKSINGTWVTTIDGDQNLLAYTYKAQFGSKWNEGVDPYARATTINGALGVVVDLSATNPAGFAPATKPAFSGNPTDAVFYELHVRDASIDASSGIQDSYKGKYLGLTQHGTVSSNGKTKTGIDAIKDLGVTHVQLLPVFDYASVDEYSNDQQNWGYDPLNYNVPEGSYATNPSDPVNRIIELKTAVQSMHSDGLRVVMDVVYNHVSSASQFSIEQLVPGYFFRTDPSTGDLANGTGCGNEVASERPMNRKFIVDSVKYWATQYGMDGFRFDLMGILDVTTMNQIRTELTAIDPTILTIGEGWNMGSVLSDSQKADQVNAASMPGISHFNDGIRDGIKGSVFNASEKGYAQGKLSAIDDVKSGIVGNVAFSGGLGATWGIIQPGQSVNYVEAHDNLTLFDKLKASMDGASAAKIKKVFLLSSSIAILAQGLPFIHAGQEFMRTKGGNDNSYQAGDKVNSLKWNSRATNADVVNFFKGLLDLRKEHAAFRMSTADQVRANLRFLNAKSGVIAYSLNGKAMGDTWSSIVVAHNPNLKAITVKLPSKGNWQIVVSGAKSGVATIKVLKNAATVSVPAQSSVVLHR